MGSRYPVSKLLEVFALREIAREHPVKQLGCTLNLVNPGWCHSELTREMTSPVVTIVKKVMCRTTDAGSRTLVDAAVSHGPDTHGQYLSNQRVEVVAALVTSTEGLDVQQRVWRELAEMLEVIQPGILKNLDG
jgi:retinol dehydrogenase-12